MRAAIPPLRPLLKAMLNPVARKALGKHMNRLCACPHGSDWDHAVARAEKHEPGGDPASFDHDAVVGAVANLACGCVWPFGDGCLDFRPCACIMIAGHKTFWNCRSNRNRRSST